MEEIKKNKTKDIIELILPTEKEKKVYLGFYCSKDIIKDMKKYAHNYKMSLGEYIEEIHNSCKNIKDTSIIKSENTKKMTWAALVEKNNFNDIKNYAGKYKMSLGEYIEYIHKLYIYNI
ncbi:hypothetical protein, partial [Brachyspira catarrhinii]